MSHPPRTHADAAEDAPRRGGEPEQDDARRALDASEARYARLVELLPDGVVTYDATGRITFANAAAARLHGVARPEDVVGQAVLEHVHPDSWASARDRMERLARGEPSPEREAAPRARGSGRILLVDDDPPVARALGRILERLGYEVTACGDGAEALARFRADPTRFDAVLTDETLPGMRGHQLTRELLALRPELPVLICTGYSEHLDEERAREIGARGLFMKPFDVAQLAEALRAALAK
jgi:PAS domain S-box-containing protein